MPSMQAPARPRRPTRRRQRTRAIIGRAIVLHRRRGAVRGIVVHEDRFPGDARQRQVQPAHQLGDIAPFLVGGDDDGKLGRCA